MKENLFTSGWFILFFIIVLSLPFNLPQIDTTSIEFRPVISTTAKSSFRTTERTLLFYPETLGHDKSSPYQRISNCRYNVLCLFFI